MNRDFIHKTLAANVPGDQQVALARVAEEASELTKEAMKALRFGIHNRYPKGDPTNAEKMRAEFADIEHALVHAGILSEGLPADLDELLQRVAKKVYRACGRAEGFYQEKNMLPDWDVNLGTVIAEAVAEHRAEHAKR